MKVLTLLGVLLLVGAGVIFYYLHHYEKNIYHDVTYEALKQRNQRNNQDLARLKHLEESSKVPIPGLSGTIAALDYEINRIDQLIFLHRFIIILIGFGFFCFAISGLFWVWERTAARRPKGFYHTGSITKDAPKVMYIDPASYHRAEAAGFPHERDAESWLRSDTFLQCSFCQMPAKAETIGTIQEVVYYEEIQPGRPKEELNHLGSVWLAKPIDKLKCIKCGRVLIRTPV